MVPAELNTRPDGLVHGFHGSWFVKSIMIVFTSLAFYNAIELVILILFTFQRYTGLYFWSMLLSNMFGVIPHALGYLLIYFNIGPLALALTLSTIGYYLMVPGQSLILYSRLHLVLQNSKVLRPVLYVIIIDTIILIVPTTVLTFSTAYIGTLTIIRAYNVMERLQVAWFCAQEFMISGIYIWEAVKLLRLMPEKDHHRHQIMYELLAINFLIIGMDIALLVLEYKGMYALQTTFKAFVYSVKLKLELGVLGRLVSLVHPQHSGHGSSGASEYPAFVDPSRFNADYTHAPPPMDNRRSQMRRHLHGISMDTLARTSSSRPVSRAISRESLRPP